MRTIATVCLGCPCGYDGDTEAELVGGPRDTVAVWTCPDCGTDHETDMSDPDMDYERSRDGYDT